jgi:hypothetical protein
MNSTTRWFSIIDWMRARMFSSMSSSRGRARVCSRAPHTLERLDADRKPLPGISGAGGVGFANTTPRVAR